jgi:hypothetical protein
LLLQSENFQIYGNFADFFFQRFQKFRCSPFTPSFREVRSFGGREEARGEGIGEEGQAVPSAEGGEREATWGAGRELGGGGREHRDPPSSLLILACARPFLLLRGEGGRGKGAFEPGDGHVEEFDSFRRNSFLDSGVRRRDEDG